MAGTSRDDAPIAHDQSAGQKAVLVDLDLELVQARMKSIQYESSLLNQVVKLQRMRIAQLEQQLTAEKRIRLVRWNLSEQGVCRNCGLDAKHGQVFCSRSCRLDFCRSKAERVAS